MLSVHTSDRLMPLADDLAQLLASASSDPMTPEWIATPSAAMQRWLSLQLARTLGNSSGSTDGVSANVTTAFPRSLLARVFEADLDSMVDSHPWQVERLTWATLHVIDQHSTDGPLARLADPGTAGSKYGRARRIAGLFDRYNLQRPGMIRQWANGVDTDGKGGPLPNHQLWQPHLWRLVRHQIGAASPAERMPDILTRLTAGELQLDLPDRLVMFGLTVVPGGPEFMQLAGAVGAHHDVHLYLLEPSTASIDEVPHPLVRSWGRLAVDAALILSEAEGSLDFSIHRHLSPSAANSTVLGHLQSGIRGNSAPTGDLLPDPGDRSIQLHACYGPQRQVEALRDSILQLLASDPTLNEDDIIVLTPSLEQFAPLIEATFGPSADTPEPPGPTTLRYRIADRSIISSNPVLAATSGLLEIATGRFEATTVLDFLGLAPVRDKFGFTSEDLSTIAEWAETTNVRWGLNPRQRERHGLPTSIETNTWESAIDRLLLGSAVVVDQSALAIGQVAAEGIEGSDTDLAGRLADVIHRLSWLSDESVSSRPVGEWLDLLVDVVQSLFASPSGQQWQVDALHRNLAEISDAAEVDGEASTSLLTFDDFRRVVGGRMAGIPGRPDFFRGGITFSSLRTLRWLPHRAICLLGLDQSAFGGSSVDGDDLVAAAPSLGDYNPRGEVRLALLEAVLSADDHLLIFRDGNHIRTNEKIPHATVIDELVDTLVAMVDPDHCHDFSTKIEIQHPRQSFDERYFAEGDPIHEIVPGFEPDSFRGAQARRQRLAATGGSESSQDITEPLQAEETQVEDPLDEVIQLADLHRFFKNPTKYFTDHELQIKLPRAHETPPSTLPVELTGLERWHLGDQMIQAALNDSDQSIERSIDKTILMERRKGSIPPGGLGDRQVEAIRWVTDEVVGAALTLGVARRPATSHTIDITLNDGTRILGSVPVRLEGPSPGPALVSYSSWKPGHLVDVWLNLMCLVASDPNTRWRAATVNPIATSEAKGAEAWEVFPSGSDPSERLEIALAALGAAVDCVRRGAREPVPLFPKVSKGIYLQATPGSQLVDPGTRGKKRPDLAADWFDSYNRIGDRSSPEVEWFYGDLDLDELLEIPVNDNDPTNNDLIPRGGRAQQFASYLWGAIDESIDLSDPEDRSR